MRRRYAQIMNEKQEYTTNEEDKILVAEYLLGKPRAFNKLFHKYRKIFLYNVQKWYGSAYDEETKQDMMIEFLGRISKKMHLYDPSKALVSTWMTNSMKNFMIEFWRRKGGKTVKGLSFDEVDFNFSIEETVHKKIEMKAHRKIIKEMLSSLGHEDTKMFNEIFIKGRTQAEVCREMGIKRSTFGYRFQRLKRRLEKFKPEGF